MLIGPQNSTLHVNYVRSRIRQAAEAAGRDPATVTLVAVTKAQTAETIRLAATAGVTDFGENYFQEASSKMDQLADLALRWHFIGGIQSNKTRAIAERFDWVHSIDRLASPGACRSSGLSTRRRSTSAFKCGWYRNRTRAASSRARSGRLR